MDKKEEPGATTDKKSASEELLQQEAWQNTMYFDDTNNEPKEEREKRVANFQKMNEIEQKINRIGKWALIDGAVIGSLGIILIPLALSSDGYSGFFLFFFYMPLSALTAISCIIEMIICVYRTKKYGIDGGKAKTKIWISLACLSIFWIVFGIFMMI